MPLSERRSLLSSLIRSLYRSLLTGIYTVAMAGWTEAANLQFSLVQELKSAEAKSRKALSILTL